MGACEYFRFLFLIPLHTPAGYHSNLEMIAFHGNVAALTHKQEFLNFDYRQNEESQQKE